MTQYNTNMRQSSYYAYCDAWVVCFEDSASDQIDMDMDIVLAESAVRAGIVFG